MVRAYRREFSRRIFAGQVCYIYVLLHCHSGNNRLWWSPPCEHRGNGVWYYLLVVSTCSNSLYHRKHDQLDCWSHLQNQEIRKFMDFFFNYYLFEFQPSTYQLMKWYFAFCANFFMVWQRETINAASSFSRRNQLPPHLQEQMLAHLSLKYRTDSEGLQQQETLNVLPKAIRSSISHYLFYALVDKVYLFHGLSNDLLFQLVIPNTSHLFWVWLCFIVISLHFCVVQI